MADKSIVDLDRAAEIKDNALLVAYQDGTAKSISGIIIKDFIRDDVTNKFAAATERVETAVANAESYADAALSQADRAETLAGDAQTSASTAEEFAASIVDSARIATQKASEAATSASTAITKASEAQTSANTATQKANAAETARATAVSKANEATTAAATASTAASTATSARADALAYKNAAEGYKNDTEALKTQTQAIADRAQEVADSIPPDYPSLEDRVDELADKIQKAEPVDYQNVKQRVSDLETDKADKSTTYTKTEVDGLIPDVPDWAKQPNKPTYTAAEVGARPSTWTPSKSDIGLGNVDNVKQYSVSNPPPYPVTSVNGETGAVTVTGGATARTATLTVAGWSTNSTFGYAQTVSVTGVTTSETQVITVDVALSTTDKDANAAMLEAFALVAANPAVQGSGTLTFYAQEKPSVAISLNVGVG